eukprot:255513-Rhodomonas_salina.1
MREKEQFRAKLDEYERLCRSLEQCLQVRCRLNVLETSCPEKRERVKCVLCVCVCCVFAVFVWVSTSASASAAASNSASRSAAGSVFQGLHVQ